jgi:hypothetical protein
MLALMEEMTEVEDSKINRNHPLHKEKALTGLKLVK